MLEALHFEAVVFTLDALHTQKNYTTIIEGSNDYIVTVKGNQPRLLA